MSGIYERNKIQAKQLFTLILKCDISHTHEFTTLFIDLHHCIQTSQLASPDQGAAGIVECLSKFLPKQFPSIVLFSNFQFDRNKYLEDKFLDSYLKHQYEKYLDMTQYIPMYSKQADGMNRDMYLLSEVLAFIKARGREYASSFCLLDSTFIYSMADEFTVIKNETLSTLPGMELAHRIVNYDGPIHLKGVSDLTLALVGMKLPMSKLSNIVLLNSPLLCPEKEQWLREVLTLKQQTFLLPESVFPLDRFFKSLCILSALSCLGYESGKEFFRTPSFEKLFVSYMNHRKVFVPLIHYSYTLSGNLEVKIDRESITEIIKLAIMGDCTKNFDEFFADIKSKTGELEDKSLYKSNLRYQQFLTIMTFADGTIVQRAVAAFACILEEFCM